MEQPHYDPEYIMGCVDVPFFDITENIKEGQNANFDGCADLAIEMLP